MLAAETTRGRRLVCALDRGVELVTTLRDLLAAREIRSAEVRGGGFLDAIELVRFDPQTRTWRASESVPGPLELVWLWGSVSEHSGDVSVRLQATVQPATGGPMLGGHIASAQIFSVELVVECFDDIILRRHPDAATGLPQWKEAISLNMPAVLPDTLTETLDQIDPARAARALPRQPRTLALDPDTDSGVSDPPTGRRYQRYPDGSPMAVFEEPTPTGQVAAAPPELERARRDSPAAGRIRHATGDPAALLAGDLIAHPKLGRCVVESVEVGGEYAKLRLRSGRIVRLSLLAVELTHRPGTTAPRIFDALL